MQALCFSSFHPVIISIDDTLLLPREFNRDNDLDTVDISGYIGEVFWLSHNHYLEIIGMFCMQAKIGYILKVDNATTLR